MDDVKYRNEKMSILKITIMCFSVTKTSSCLLKNTRRTRNYSLHQFSAKLPCAELVNTCALFAGLLFNL